MVCVCEEEEEEQGKSMFKGDRDGCMHMYLCTDMYVRVYVCI